MEEVAARPARQPLARLILSAAADLILPPVCMSCRARVGAHGLLCGACFASIDFIAPPICARSARRFLTRLERRPSRRRPSPGRQSTTARAPPLAIPRPCARSSRASNMGTGTRAEALRPLARQGGRGASRRRLPDRAGAALPWAALVAALQPVGDARARGGAAYGPPCRLLHLEARAADGRPVGLTADQRRRNVRGAFKVERARRDRIKGRNIVVVDDVITTGATAEACARALKRAGAARVDVLALARASTPRPSCSRRRIVMPDLIRASMPLCLNGMDCRVEPGNDEP